MTSPRPIPRSKASSARRTNSLGSAKTDCHSCSSLRQTCDRQRPQCGTCQRQERKCGGYVLNLVWKDHSLGEVPTLTPATKVSDDPAPLKRQFRFRQGRPKTKRKSCKCSSIGENNSASLSVWKLSGSTNRSTPPIKEMSPWPDAMDEEVVEAMSIVDEYLPWFEEDERGNQESYSIVPSSSAGSWAPRLMIDDAVNFWPELSSPSDNLSINSPGLFLAGTSSPEDNPFPFVLGPPTDGINPFYNEPNTGGLTPQISGTSENDYRLYRRGETPFSQGVSYNDVMHKFGSVLTMYDEEFCVLPLTNDCNTNPFRVIQESWKSSRFLLHAILAVSAQHLAKKSNDSSLTTEMLIHRSIATHLYSEALVKSNTITLLDTLLILLNLDATQSASGTWDVHLIGAYKLLEAKGGVEVCRWGPRIRAQVAMLVWWDVTIGFINRQEPLFPIKYLDTLLSYDHNDGWTFFDLNGCPGLFVLAMARLAKLASIYEKVSALEWTSFNMLPVDSIIEDVKNWKNTDEICSMDVDELEDMDAKRDRFHCIEAWRHAVVLYALRVFTRKQDHRSLQSINHIKRVILDHIRCIKEDMIIQKQILIPLFLAAAETGDAKDRAFVQQYCKHWSSKSRYSMFENTEVIIKCVWADWHAATRDTYWWGVKVRSGSPLKSRREDPMATRLLLG